MPATASALPACPPARLPARLPACAPPALDLLRLSIHAYAYARSFPSAGLLSFWICFVFSFSIFFSVFPLFFGPLRFVLYVFTFLCLFYAPLLLTLIFAYPSSLPIRPRLHIHPSIHSPISPTPSTPLPSAPPRPRMPRRPATHVTRTHASRPCFIPARPPIPFYECTFIFQSSSYYFLPPPLPPRIILPAILIYPVLILAPSYPPPSCTPHLTPHPHLHPPIQIVPSRKCPA